MAAPVSPSTLDAPFTVQDRRRKGFFTLDNALFDQYGSQLKAHGLAVYVALARFVNQDGACWPSLATIAKRTGMSRMQVIREIGKLQELRLIAVEHQQGEKGEYRSNIYILLDIPEVVTAREQGSNTQLPPLVTTSDHPSNTQLPPLVTGSDHPSNCVLPKQDIENKTQKQNKTQRTTSRARAKQQQHWRTNRCCCCFGFYINGVYAKRDYSRRRQKCFTGDCLCKKCCATGVDDGSRQPCSAGRAGGKRSTSRRQCAARAGDCTQSGAALGQPV